MSTATNPIPRINEKVTRVLGETSPIDRAISRALESSFRVCENCSAPALEHPRVEMNAIALQTRRRVLCCACLHTENGTDHQLWRCVECDGVRKWGTGRPWDFAAKKLRCQCCGKVQPHEFARTVGR